MRRLFAFLMVLFLIAGLLVTLMGQVYAAPSGGPVKKSTQEDSLGPDYVTKRIQQEAGLGGGNVNWGAINKRIVDGAMWLVRYLKKTASVPLLLIVSFAGIVLLFSFLFSLTKVVRWALGVMFFGILGWMLIQAAPLIVAWLTGIFA